MRNPVHETSSLTRRSFLKGSTAAAVAASLPIPASAGMAGSYSAEDDRSSVNALLISATTLKGKGSLEHAHEAMRELYGSIRRILLINFASLPGERDAYAERMQRDFRAIHPDMVVDSLHQVDISRAEAAVRKAEAFYVSGGNTFLLLRELYDRKVVDLMRKRVLGGVPYAGSSAGSNIGGLCIGTTNDFPITDVPTRRSLGLFNGIYNPHHPEEAAIDFASRQWKIRQYARFNPDETVVGVPDSGMLRIQGNRVTLLGEGAVAFVQQGGDGRRVNSGEAVFQ
ncbi:MAG: dipeptidase PepE [Puniceicoccaceae bacterium]